MTGPDVDGDDGRRKRGRLGDWWLLAAFAAVALLVLPFVYDTARLQQAVLAICAPFFGK